MVFKIKLENANDVRNLTDVALDYDGDLTVTCGSTSIDARSLLALFTLIGKKGINLVASDYENPQKFAELVKKFD